MRGTSTFQPKSGLVSNQANSSLRSTLGDTMAIVTSNASLPLKTRSTAPSVVATDAWRTVVARSLSATGDSAARPAASRPARPVRIEAGAPTSTTVSSTEVYAV